VSDAVTPATPGEERTFIQLAYIDRRPRPAPSILVIDGKPGAEPEPEPEPEAEA
jgi:hypothetical protein